MSMRGMVRFQRPGPIGSEVDVAVIVVAGGRVNAYLHGDEGHDGRRKDRSQSQDRPEDFEIGSTVAIYERSPRDQAKRSQTAEAAELSRTQRQARNPTTDPTRAVRIQSAL